MVGRKNVDIRIQWTAMPSTLRTTDLEDLKYWGTQATACLAFALRRH